MATRRVKLTGIAEWSKVFAQNRDTKGYEGAYEDCDGACTIDLIMDDSNLSLLQASRSMKKGSPDIGGRGTKVKFVRKYDTGRDWDSGAPVVLKPDDSKWDLEVDGFIGNGSKVEVYLLVFPVTMASASPHATMQLPQITLSFLINLSQSLSNKPSDLCIFW